LLSRNVAQNLANEAAEHWDERKLSRQLRDDARTAWEGYCSQAGGFHSDDFADGFRAGYADYLESGGPGCPPAVPPLRYRRRDHLNPEGHARVRDYFEGFKTGTDVAATGGRRPYLTVPVLMSDPPPPGPLPGTQVPATAVVRNGEQLPIPRPMEPITGLSIPERPPMPPVPLPRLPDVEPPADPLRPKIPDVPEPKIPVPPPKPRSDAKPQPSLLPVSLRETSVPEPVFRRLTPPPIEPLPGRRVVIE